VPRQQAGCYISSEMLYKFYVTLLECGTSYMYFNISISICIFYPDHEDVSETYHLYLWPVLATAEDHTQSNLSHRSFMYGHILELLVKIELPLAFSALQVMCLFTLK